MQSQNPDFKPTALPLTSGILNDYLQGSGFGSSYNDALLGSAGLKYNLLSPEQLQSKLAETQALYDKATTYTEEPTYNPDGSLFSTMINDPATAKNTQSASLFGTALYNLQNLLSNQMDFNAIFDYTPIAATEGTSEIPGSIITPGTPSTPYQPGTPGLPGSPYSLSDVQSEASDLSGQLGGLNDILANISDKYKPIDSSFYYNRFNLTDPLQSPGRPEENFLRRNLQGAVVTPKVK